MAQHIIERAFVAGATEGLTALPQTAKQQDGSNNRTEHNCKQLVSKFIGAYRTHENTEAPGIHRRRRDDPAGSAAFLDVLRLSHEPPEPLFRCTEVSAITPPTTAATTAATRSNPVSAANPLKTLTTTQVMKITPATIKAYTHDGRVDRAVR